MEATEGNGQFSITGPNSNRKIVLSGINFKTNDQDGSVTVSNLQYTHLFFISMLDLVENPSVPQEIKTDIEQALPLLSTILKQVSVDLSEDKENIRKIKFTLHNLDRLKLTAVSEEDGQEVPVPIEDISVEAAEHIQSVVLSYLQSPGVMTALKMASVIVEGETIELQQEQGSRQDRLFPNSKHIDPKVQFGVPHFLSTNINRAIKSASRSKAIEQYERSASHSSARRPNFKIKNKGQDSETEFVFDKDKLAIRTAEQFADKLMKLKDAKVLQTFFALMKWMNLNDTSVFRNVPISDIMELILKPSGANKFNTPQRREFSEVLEYLASVTITISIIGERLNHKTGKSKPVLQEESGVKLFRFIAEYSVRKEFQSIPKESLHKDIHFDKSVITRFSGEILPGHPHLFQKPGTIYYDSLLHLDANKDSKAIIMGFNFQTRFDQLNQDQVNEKCIDVDRAFLIDLCDYQKTNQTKPSQATKQLSNNLDKLIQSGIISKYTGLTNKDEDRIKIYPPKQKESAKPATKAK